MTQELTQEEQNELASKSQDMLTQAREMTITNEMQNSQAATFTATLKAEIKRRKKLLEPTKEALDAFSNSPELAAAIEEMQGTWKGGEIDIKWRATYEPIKTWER